MRFYKTAMGELNKSDIVQIAVSMLDNRTNPSRQDMKRAAGRALERLIIYERASVEDVLEALEVEYSYEESLESKIDKALWHIFAAIVVFIDKEKMRW